jgi:alpha-ketoglutarate-dependent taurine dioxygenase
MSDAGSLFHPWPTERKKGWVPADLVCESLTWRLEPEVVAALLALVETCKAKGRSLAELTIDDFRHPALDAGLSRMEGLLKTGPGLVFLANLPYDECPLDDIKLMYWGIGTHFGRAVSQNRNGELMGEVRVRPDMVTGRAYGHAGGLLLHSDRIDILSLFCVRKPLSGGANLFVSSLKVWEIIEQERPDLIPILERGFRMNRMGEHREPGQESTDYHVPVYATVDGLRSALISGNALGKHQRTFFLDELGPNELEALDFFSEVQARPELALHLELGLGEAVFINNYEIVHSREAFEDGQAEHERRLLLRLWLEGMPARPKPDAMIVMRNPSGRQGIDPWPKELLEA